MDSPIIIATALLPYLTALSKGAQPIQCQDGETVCTEKSLCISSQTCDGLSLECSDGRDESLDLCESEEWVSSLCWNSSWLRCSGHRPGQCYEASSGRCNGVYDCIDRSDESGCGIYENDDSGLFGEGLSEEVAETAGEWALVTLVVGLPLTWLVKHYCIKWFVAAFGTEKSKTLGESDGRKRRHRRERDEQLALSSDEDVLLMLEFICAMVSRVEEAGHAITDAGHKDENLWSLFERVHATEAWSENARVVFDMGHLLFDSKMEFIDEFHIAMYELEKRYHDNVNLDLNLCLKHDLGNKMVKEIRWSTEPPGIRKIEKLLPTALVDITRKVWFRALLIYVGLLADTISYYFDFVKDWVIFAILFKSIDRSSFYLFEVQLVILLFVFLLLPEIIRGAYFATNYKLILGITDWNFPKIPQNCLKLSIAVLSPFVPAVLLWERGRIEYDCLKIQKSLSTRIESCMDNPREKMDKTMIDAFKEDFKEYHETLLDDDLLVHVTTDTKYLEASTETLFQYVLQLLVVLVVLADSATVEVTPGLESVFFDKGVGVLLYLSLTLSFISLTNTRVKLEGWKKFGLFNTKAKVFFGTHSALTLLTKITCIVLYFAPSMGLFGFSNYYESGNVSFAESFIVDVQNDTTLILVDNIWPAPAEDYVAYTIANLGTLYVFFIFFIPFLCAGLYILKRNLIRSFWQSRSLSSQVLHVISCLAFPSVYRDWDEKRTEDPQIYSARYRQVREEQRIMTLWHLAANATFIIPLLYTCIIIMLKHSELLDAGFSPTEEEENSYITAIVLVVLVPLLLAVLAFVEWKLMEVYYHSAHPWSLILVDLPSAARRPSTNAHKTDAEYVAVQS